MEIYTNMAWPDDPYRTAWLPQLAGCLVCVPV